MQQQPGGGPLEHLRHAVEQAARAGALDQEAATRALRVLDRPLDSSQAILALEAIGISLDVLRPYARSPSGRSVVQPGASITRAAPSTPQ